PRSGLTPPRACGAAGGKVPFLSRQVLTVIPAVDGSSFHRDSDGNFWRAYLFISGARTYDIPLNNEQVYRAARMFREFQEMLTDLPGPPLHETIPNFHNAPLRFKRFRQVLKADSCNRAMQAAPGIDFLLKQAGIFDVLPRLVEKGQIPVRITHNDTKINNVMFDDETGEGLCVIDLDTVMPGLSLYDFGDLARTTLCHAAEDERDLRKVKVDLSRFEAIVNGYLSTAGGFLKKSEREHLITGAKMMTLLIGMRFLIDFLEGDPYYKTHREAHNLERCRVQFTLVQSIIEHEEEMTKLIPDGPAGGAAHPPSLPPAARGAFLKKRPP
ncbi:MAG: aminoglycoside phosphotransferase family protein, partial [Candidatus Aminicenantes bacterium]|nr:aminoglycoside phosphotransferase family protein [Candidatus Aminicenantes bacterium]